MANQYKNKVVYNGTTLIDLSDTTAVQSDVVSGKYFYTASGERVAGTGSTGNINDVQINGTSIVENGVANIPYAAYNKVGVVQVDTSRGTAMSGSTISTFPVDSATVKTGVQAYQPITPAHQHESVFYGLAKAAGDSTQASSENAVGTYTENAKSAISEMLGGSVSVSGTTPTIVAKSGIRYICGEVLSLDFTPSASGICDVVFISGSTPTVLTVPSTVKWANGFDPTSLDTNTTYELNIMDGLGVACAWT